MILKFATNYDFHYFLQNQVAKYSKKIKSYKTIKSKHAILKLSHSVKLTSLLEKQELKINRRSYV